MATLSPSPLELGDWPTIEEAAAQLQASERTLWRYAQSGRVEMRKRPRSGKKPENVCNPRDIEKLLPTAHVMPAEDAAVEKQALVPAARNEAIARSPGSHPWHGALEAIATILSTRQDTVEIGTKLWLSLEEAAAYSGLSESFLRDSIVAPEHYEPGENVIGIRGGRHGAWRIRRASLEAFAG